MEEARDRMLVNNDESMRPWRFNLPHRSNEEYFSTGFDLYHNMNGRRRRDDDDEGRGGGSSGTSWKNQLELHPWNKDP